jgi:hypothetical protein
VEHWGETKGTETRDGLAEAAAKEPDTLLKDRAKHSLRRLCK